MKIKKIDLSNHKETSFVEILYTESFPRSERRPVETMFDLYRENHAFEIAIIMEEEQILGFFTYWDLDKFIFAEHFAISPVYRNRGYGHEAMNLLIEGVSKPIVLEVELPNTILSERRIGFYQRLSFRLWENIQYQQPSYYKDGNAIPMKLMSFGDIDIEHDLINIRSKIYSTVYNC